MADITYIQKNHIDIGYLLWDAGYRIDYNHKEEAERSLVGYINHWETEDISHWIETHPDWVINEAEEEARYRAENEPKIRQYFAEHIEGKAWEEIDQECWDFYSDWHKDVFGYRPHGIVCGVYVNPHKEVR